jgi:biotin carboxyl carrier protein
VGEEIAAPMPGVISEVLVKAGDEVKTNDELVILEAMKMENPIVAPIDGKVTEVKVVEKDRVDTGDILLVLE